MNYLKKHILICTDSSSCGPQGAEEIRQALKAELKRRGLRLYLRDGACSCLGLCLKGVNAAIWPEGKFLAGVTVGDVPRLVDYLEGKGAALTDLEELADAKTQKKLAEATGAKKS